MQKSKIYFVILIMLCILSVGKLAYADEEIEEADASTEEIEEILEATANMSDEPSINARHAVILDRTSRENSLWKR